MIMIASNSVAASQASSCVEFVESMRGKFYAMLVAGGGSLTRPREKGRSTPKERAACVALAEAGNMPDEVARQMGRSSDWVRGVLREAGVDWFLKGNRKANSGRRRDLELEAKALRMLSERQLSPKEIGALLGKSAEWVRVVRKRAEKEATA